MIKHWVSRGWLAGLLAASAGCAAGGPASATPTPLPQIVSSQQIVFTVERGPIISQIEVNGEIVPAHQDELAFGASGLINRVLVQAGDQFKKGEVLAELKMDDLLEQLAQAQIDLEVSQQNLAVDQAQQAYDLQQAESDAVIAEKQVELAQLTVAAAGGTQQAVAQLNLEIAQAELKTAEARLALVQAQSASQLDQVVQRNQNAVDSLNRQMAERQLIAPYDGIVLVMGLIPGLQATAFASMVVVGDLGQIVVRVPWNYDLVNGIDASTAAYLHPTQAAEPEYPVQFIENFLPISNPQSGISVSASEEVSLNYLYFSIPEDTPRAAVSLGSAVRLRVILGSKPDALLLSPATIRGTDAFHYVIVLEDDYHRRVEVVSIGVKTDDKWEVIANLKEGDQILGP